MSRVSPVFLVLLGAALLVFIQSYALLSPIILSFILILLISLAINPVVAWLRKITGGRKVATAVVTTAFVLLLCLTAWAFYIPMKTSASKLVQRLPQYWERVQKPLLKFERQAVLSEARLREEVTTEVAREASAAGQYRTARQALESSDPPPAGNNSSIRANLLQMLQGAGGRFTSVAVNTAQILVVFVTVFFGVVFTLMNPRPIFRAFFYLVPEASHPKLLRVLQGIGAFVPHWALATLLGMLTIGLLVFLLMWPIFGFFDALILGVIAGALEAVPYLGPVLSAVPAILLAFGKGGMTPLWVVLAYILVQALENNLVSPLIMARSMRLHPLAVIFSMLLCVAAFGVLGVLIAAPVVAILLVLYDELYRPRLLPSSSDDRIDELARRSLYDGPTRPPPL